jgi:hypothetical protein
MAMYGRTEDQLAYSVEALDITSTRPDIKAAKDANAVIKSKLGYRDEDELDTGVQKVQPLPFLDEEILKYHAQIRESVTPAQRVNDKIPSQVLQKVDRATDMAKQGETSLFKASQLLEFTFEAYQYARWAAQDQYDLKRTSEQHLTKFEEDFKNMIKYRLEADLAKAAVELENCQHSLEEALEESKGDVGSQEARARDEDAVIEDSSLQESHEQVKEMVRVEKSELHTIGEQCLKDMRTIDEELRTLKQRKNRVDEQCKLEDAKRAKQLKENREEQRELEKRLRALREEEARLVKERKTEEQLQHTADETYAATERDILGWRGKIEHLRARTETSLGVMTCMEECTDMIMEDAKGKKRMWKERLRETAVESLWILRETLLIKGAAFMMVLEDNKCNQAESTKLIAHYENEKISAARSGFAPRVNDAKRCIMQYKGARTEYEQKIAESSEIIKTIREEMATLDEKLHSLRPRLKRDTLENRYEEMKQKKGQAFSAMSTDGIVFSFYHRLPQ